MTTPLEIPLFAGVPLYDIRVTLSGKEYLLRFDWNGRESRYYFSISTGEGLPIASGIKVIANWPLLRKVSGEIRPPGELFAVDYSAQKGEPPGLNDLGTRVRLAYFPPANI